MSVCSVIINKTFWIFFIFVLFNFLLAYSLKYIINFFYLRDGTTDVTRTLHFGDPTDFQKEAYTRVLKGQLTLGATVFPNKIKVSFIF